MRLPPEDRHNGPVPDPTQAPGIFVKTHHPRTDPALLQRRLDAIRSAPFVQPLGPVEVTDGDVVTRWPLVGTADPENPPWFEAGALLARLHALAAPADAPPHGWPERLSRALTRAPDELVPLGRRLLAEVAAQPPGPRLIHGDWHLGQLGQQDGEWLLVDVDDVGLAWPAWDLARPAGFWAAGLLSDEDWNTFLTGYGSTPPWPELDLPARCAVFVAAARPQLHSRHTADSLLAACRRMAL